MLIKEKDDIQPTFDLLNGFLASPNLTVSQREGIEEELKRLRAGVKGEREAAYHIDFALKDGKNWAIIHDLRLEHHGRVAQIDHLIIGRMFDLIVVESKNVRTALRLHENGEFEVETRWGWRGMASPVEQNKKHIQVLGGLITDEKLTPTRLGFHIPPRFRNWVLVSPECCLPKQRCPDAAILRMDLFDRRMDEHNSKFSDMLTLAKVCASETIRGFAEKLVAFHRPATFNYAAWFGITNTQRYAPPAPAPARPARPLTAERNTCEHCRASVEAKVVAFCRSREKWFGGKILCRTCQATISCAAPVREPVGEASGSTCHECKKPVEAKVVNFCRANSRRFGKRVLCRVCQTHAVATAT